MESSTSKMLARVATLSDEQLMKVAATVMEELRQRGLLFGATAAIVDWQDKWFMLANDPAQ